MLDRVAEFIGRHRMFETGQRVGVAVSGGADSVFLLHALHELGAHWNLKLSVVHVEHGIRGADSTADAEFVGRLAASFALPFYLHSADVPAMRNNLEQAARNARHGFYRELLASSVLDRIATGHTHNDQAETVLYRMLRGSGLAGLAGILPVTAEQVVRPILQLQRCEIEAWLRERGVEWREDTTNTDISYARNRIRHEILPLLRRTFNPRLDDSLVHLGMLAQDEQAYWNAELDRYALSPSDAPVLSTQQLTQASPAVARRLIRRAIEHVKGDLRQIDFSHIERILEMSLSASGHDRVQLPGAEVIRSFEYIRFARSSAQAQPEFSLPIRVPGWVELPGGSARITLRILENDGSKQPHAKVVNDLDWRRVTVTGESGFELRSWRPGDRYQGAGQPQPEKLKVLFQKARIPLWERHKWPIITYNENILWVRRFGAAAKFAAGPDTEVILRVGETFCNSAESSRSSTTSNI